MRFPVLAFLRQCLGWPLQLAHTTARLFGQNRLQNHAAAAAFYFLLSATPLLLLLSYALQLLGRLAENSVPATILMAALYDQMRLDTLTELGFIPRQAQLTVGGIGLLTLVLSSRGLVNAVQGAFSVIFPYPKKRNLVLSWVLPLIVLPLLFLLMGLAVLAQMTLSFLAQHNFIGSGNAQMLQVLNSLFGFAMVWSLLFAAYWRLPRQHPSAPVAALFALAATLSLAVLFSLFGTFYKLENLRSLYGAPGSVVFVLTGAFLAFLLFYLWAQAQYAYGKADITALEKLFLGHTSGVGRFEAFVFGDPHRLLDKYGEVHPAGHTLIEEGSDSRTSYFLHTGRAHVYKHTDAGQRQIGTLKAGQLFGEMAYLLNEKRTASIIAETEITVMALPPHVLEELMTHSAPLSRRIIDTLCQRLQQMILVSST
ncbi:MAG: cyclic nucleotide-binding domain-containing protein [Gammaproteobacteria bacterium]|nr:cyclic nucleotide-binding domain-containing protein [Gammaproteobacteria bacterium]